MQGTWQGTSEELAGLAGDRYQAIERDVSAASRTLPIVREILEHGFRSLAKACKDRAFGVIAIRVDPRFEPLLGDGRFDAIRREIGLENVTR